MNLDQSKEPLKKLKIALEKAELSKYLIGDNGYEFPNRWVEEPTDLGTIFTLGFNLYVEEYGAEFLNDEIEKALIKLMETPIGCWWVIVIIYSSHYRFVESALKFEINIDNLVPELSLKLQNYKLDLINNKSWVGYRFNKGLWEQIENFVPKINEYRRMNNMREINL